MTLKQKKILYPIFIAAIIVPFLGVFSVKLANALDTRIALPSKNEKKINTIIVNYNELTAKIDSLATKEDLRNFYTK